MILKRFFGKDTQEDRFTEIKGKGIISHLIKAARERVYLDIKLDKEHASYQSMLLDIFPQMGYILIDSLVPEQGDKLIKKSKMVLVNYKLSGVIHTFRSRYLKEILGKYPSFAIAIPDKIVVKQKRNYYRVSPSPSENVVVGFRNSASPGETSGGAFGYEPGEIVYERVLDISGGGLRFATRVGEEVLSPGVVLDPLIIELPKGTVIICKGVVRRLSRNPRNTEKPYICGVEFYKLRERERQNITRYVVRRQVEEIRKRKREGILE